jgi:2-dehydro-3-deoxyphosphogluconate aldolase / (4S)-4-hydroxy-2-oxoglutarate aldolase
MNLLELVRQCGIVPVVSLPKVEHALPLAEALIAGGLACAEITFRTAAAAEAIAQIRTAFPQMLVGAGTVLSAEQARTALDAGAQFVVSPGSSPAVIEYCQGRGATIFPGVATPTEIEAARARGLSVLKFFPAEPMGGVKFLKAVSAPYRDVRFIPTGGVDATNVRHYLALPPVVACGGSWMVKPELLEQGNFAAVRQMTEQAVALVEEVRRAGGQ